MTGDGASHNEPMPAPTAFNTDQVRRALSILDGGIFYGAAAVSCRLCRYGALGANDLWRKDYASSSNGSNFGWNQICAMRVGTTALPITAVSRMVY